MQRRHLILGSLCCVLIVLGWLWFTLLSPFYYERPAHLADIEPGEHAVFVYGTLRFAPLRWLVMGRAGESETAVLEGYRRDGLDLSEASGERVVGEVIVVEADELARLDRYERLGIRYTRVPMRLSSGRSAWVYHRLDGSLQSIDSSASF